MYQRVKPDIKQDLLNYGAKEWNECFNCGNCTAICPLTNNSSLFPRKAIHQIQMGLKKSLASNVDPWLCYYCGECTETCPRDANPGELMMAVRRYLTSIYDWTGLSKRFYTNHIWEYGFLAFFALAVIALFAIFLPPAKEIFTDPAAFVNDQGGVMINSLVAGMQATQFVRIIEYGDLLMGAILAALLISNILRMYYFTIIKDNSVKVSFISHFREFWSLLYNFITQPKFSKCDDKKYWGGHFLIVSGYTIMFILVVGFLYRFQTEQVYEWYHWQRILGYYATFGILLFLLTSLIGRIRKKSLKFQYSHPSDYLFIIMLGLTTVSGILVHIFRVTGLPAATYFIYVIHLAVLFPMIVVEVPFSKWSHLAYRPFAVYFYRLKRSAKQRQVKADLAEAA